MIALGVALAGCGSDDSDSASGADKPAKPSASASPSGSAEADGDGQSNGSGDSTGSGQSDGTSNGSGNGNGNSSGGSNSGGSNADAIRSTDWSAQFGEMGCEAGLVVEDVVYGELTSDGVTDAVVAASCDSTTSGNPDKVAVFEGTKGGAERMGVLIEDSDPLSLRVNGLTISGKTVTISALGFSENAALCCPDRLYTQKFVFDPSVGYEGQPATITPYSG